MTTKSQVMRVLVTGARGMLGQELAPALRSLPAIERLDLCDVQEFDLRDAAAVRDWVLAARPNAILHCAAWTDVDGSEADPDLAMQINGQGTRNISAAAEEAGARLLYLSTDYVFDGTGRRPYTESDVPTPLNAYARSKRAGEEYTSRHPDSLIVRTSWLYGRGGKHFVGAILDRARKGEALRVVNDQFGSPTWTRHLSRALAQLIVSGERGIVHACGGGSCSWYEFAAAIVEEAAARGLAQQVPVQPVATAEFPRPAKRPAYSVLSTERLRQLGMALPHWRDALREFLAETA